VQEGEVQPVLAVGQAGQEDQVVLAAEDRQQLVQPVLVALVEQ
jgi:hypothetical protein